MSSVCSQNWFSILTRTMLLEESQMINQQEHGGPSETPCLDSSKGPASKDVRRHYTAPVTVPSEERARVREHRHTTTLSFIVGDFQHTK